MISYDECNSIVELDLDPIKVKLMHKQSGEGWTLEQASAVEVEYRRFLYLCKAFHNEAVAPLEDVDTFWHYHILDTMKYAQDCRDIFGRFLHHFPYVGMRGAEDLTTLQRMGERTRALYEQSFGDDYHARAIECRRMASRSDGTATAFCGDVTANAFCGASTVTASGADGTATAFCGDVAANAFCGASTVTASGADGTASAFCGDVTANAFCGASTLTASGADGTATAFCGDVTADAFRSDSRAADHYSKIKRTDFALARPRLVDVVPA
jgi:hypothetical protein